MYKEFSEKDRKMRFKKMPVEQFKDILQCKWMPLRLENNCIPSFLTNMPKEKLNCVYASGDYLETTPYSDEFISSGDIIGGIDVYRNAPEDPVNLNKDWYAVITSPMEKNVFLVKGPIKDNEHWLNDIPKRLKGAQVLAVPQKNSDVSDV